MRRFSAAVFATCSVLALSSVALSSVALATDQDENFRLMNRDYVVGHGSGAQQSQARDNDHTIVTGSVVTTPPPAQWDSKWAACAWRYPSFNPRTGTFIGEDRLVHVCQ